MELIRPEERQVVGALAALLDCNPFLPERVALEQRILGDAFIPITTVWHADDETAGVNPNTARLREVAEHLGEVLRGRLQEGATFSGAERADYEGLVRSLLWLRYEDDWWALIEGPKRLKKNQRIPWYSKFARDVRRFFSVLPGPLPDAAHLFALGFQGRRAFHHIYRKIFGGSLSAMLLRAAIWDAIFTDDLPEYREYSYDRLARISTMIIGESGTGKELAARAIALSLYVPFDDDTQTFAADPAEGFCAVNLSELSPMLIESEIFGHCRGAFTGAIHDRSGLLEMCGPHGAVFLDEIGDVDVTIQVKLLRVLQSREFRRVGESTRCRFDGKLISATHRDLQQEIQAGRFRHDLYQRICGNLVRTPTLREQLADKPDELPNLVRIAAGRIARPDRKEHLARKVEQWMQTHLPSDYPWPGNMRELEHCVHQVFVSRASLPSGVTAPVPAAVPVTPGGATSDAPQHDDTDPFMADVRDGKLDAAALLQGYCARVHQQTGNYLETARRLNINWKTVRAKAKMWGQRVASRKP